MRGRKARRPKPLDAYDEAVERAALAPLTALPDHANPQFSSVQLEALRLRKQRTAIGGGERRPCSPTSVSAPPICSPLSPRPGRAAGRSPSV